MLEFRWNDWNVEHIAEHGVTPREAEQVIRRARSPFPRKIGPDEYLVRGRTIAGDYLQVIYVLDPEKTIFVIHGRPLRDPERRRFRRQGKT